ncbi:MAG: DegV family protein [Bacillota bacterium]
MEKIAIVTDSTCDIPDGDLLKYNIKMIPLRILYSFGELRDRIETTAEEVYEGLQKEIPKTSLPMPLDVTTLFEELVKEGYTHALVTTLSSGLSGTYNMIKNVVTKFKELEVEVIDSKSLSFGLGFPVLEAAKEVLSSNSFSKAVDKAKEVIVKTDTFYAIDTLEYLRKGGRIGLVEGTIGQLLGIKPIISINEEGKYFTFSKVRGRNQSINELFKIVKERTNGEPFNVAVMHGHAKEEALKLLERIKGLVGLNEVYFDQISPVLGVHTGPGLLGVIVYKL